jgi:hypothetical protein
MASLRRLRSIRRLEYLVFGGVPEAPEPMFERDGNPQAEGRTTGRALGGAYYPLANTEQTDGILEFDPETGIVTEIETGSGKEGVS